MTGAVDGSSAVPDSFRSFAIVSESLCLDEPAQSRTGVPFASVPTRAGIPSGPPPDVSAPLVSFGDRSGSPGGTTPHARASS
jgi:hypothetical protein